MDNRLEDINKILEDFLNTIYRSGYSRDETKNYLTSAIVGFERRKVNAKEGKGSLHRDGVRIKAGTRF